MKTTTYHHHLRTYEHPSMLVIRMESAGLLIDPSVPHEDDDEIKDDSGFLSPRYDDFDGVEIEEE